MVDKAMVKEMVKVIKEVKGVAMETLVAQVIPNLLKVDKVKEAKAKEDSKDKVKAGNKDQKVKETRALEDLARIKLPQ